MKPSVAIAGIFIFVMTMLYINVNQDGDISSSPVQADVESDVTVLRFGHNSHENTALHQASLRFAKLVSEKTEGQVKVDIYPAQQLGNDHEMVEMARNGKLDLLLTPTAKMSVPVPSMQYADLPFYFPTREDLYAMLDGEPGRMLFRDMAKIGLVGMAFWENGFKHFTGNSPLLSPEDFAGKKIRVMKSRIIMEQFQSFDAEPVPIDFYSTRQALADSVVDGQENPLIAIVSMGFHEVQSDLTLSEHAYLGYVFSISEMALTKLPQQVKIALFDAAKEVTPWERAETQRREAELLETIRKSGVRVHQLSEASRMAFAQRTQHIVKRAEKIIGPAIISKTDELLEQRYGPKPADLEQIVIGLNVDLSNEPGSGLAIKRGAQLAIDEINERGGLLGKPVKLLTKDHRIVTSLGRENIEYFINRPDVVAVLGGKHSAVVVSEMDLVQEAGIPYLIPWAASAKVTENGYTDNFIFRNSANDHLASIFIAKQALKRSKKIAIIVEKTVWGRGNLERMSAFLAQQNAPVSTAVVYNLGQESYEQEVLELVGSDADAFILVANAREGALLLDAIHRLKPTAAVISHWGILGDSLWDDNFEVLHNMDLSFFQTFSFKDNPRSGAMHLAGLYREIYAQESDKIDSPNGVAQAYDLVYLLAAAIENAGAPDRRQIKEALEQLDNYQGVIKNYTPAFTKADHDAMDEADFLMAHFNEKGEVVPVSAKGAR